MEDRKNRLKTLLQLALKANKLAFGHDFVVRLIEKRKVALLLIANDIGKSSYQSIIKHVTDMNIDIIKFGTKDDYYQILGKNTAIIAVLDINFRNGIRNLFSNENKEKSIQNKMED